MIRKATNREYLPKVPYFTFVTLTLSSKQINTDQELRRKMLTPFIQVMQRKFNVWHYLYVCEKQTNGNIHFHILIDSFIKWQLIREEWNKIQTANGYTDEYFKTHQHRNPNSTDIHKLDKVQDLSSYVVKYCTVEKKDIKLDGRLWGCSDPLRKLKPYEEIISGGDYAMLAEMAEKDYIKVEVKEQYTLFTGKIFMFLEQFHKEKYNKISNHLKEQVNNLYRIHPAIRAQIEIEKTRKEKIEEASAPIHIQTKFINQQLTLSL